MLFRHGAVILRSFFSLHLDISYNLPASRGNDECGIPNFVAIERENSSFISHLSCVSFVTVVGPLDGLVELIRPLIPLYKLMCACNIDQQLFSGILFDQETSQTFDVPAQVPDLLHHSGLCCTYYIPCRYRTVKNQSWGLEVAVLILLHIYDS